MDDGSLTQRELQAELDTLRSLRRRSVSQPSEGIDPDLPPSPNSFSLSAPGSPNFTQRSPTLGSGSPPYAGSPRTPTSSTFSLRSDASTSRSASLIDVSSSAPDNEASMDDDVALGADYSDLFWLPARLHPEIAPQEFRNFLKDQTTPENLLRRSGSTLGRKKSMLSKQVHLSDMGSDGDESTRVKGKKPAGVAHTPSRTSSFSRSTGLERLTLNDLQRLEELARQAAEEGQAGAEGEAKLKHMVRRSMSLNPASLLENADEIATLTQDHDKPFEHEADAPLIVPPPGSILRRSARTKIRKPSLLGDGGGHRFGPSRRTHRSISPMLEDEEVADDRVLTNDDRKTSISSQISLETSESTSTDETATDSPTCADVIVTQLIPMQYFQPTRSPHDEIISRSDCDERQHGPEQRHTPHAVGSKTQSLLQTSPTRTKNQIQVGTVNLPTQTSDFAHSQHTTHSQITSSMGPQTTPQNAVQATERDAGTVNIAKTGPQVNNHTATHIRPRTVSAPTRPNMPASREEPGHESSALPPGAAPAGSIAMVASHSQTKALSHHPQSVAKPQNLQISLPHNGKAAASKSKEKKTGWAKLGLPSRSVRADTDADDAASVHSTASSHSTFSLKSDKSAKKSKKDQEKDQLQDHKKPVVTSPERRTADTPKEKSEGSGGGFFGGIFGSRRKTEQTDDVRKEAEPVRIAMPTPPPTASGMLTAEGRYVTFYRLPIHIERAVYRLSHIKLANPRRPLYEQVLISNLMFWYLGVINKPPAPPVTHQLSHQKSSHSASSSNRSQDHRQQSRQPGSLNVAPHASPQHMSGQQLSHGQGLQQEGMIPQSVRSDRSVPDSPAVISGQHGEVPMKYDQPWEEERPKSRQESERGLQPTDQVASSSQSQGHTSPQSAHDLMTPRPDHLYAATHNSSQHARPTSVPNSVEEKVDVIPRPLSDSSQPQSSSPPITSKDRVPPPIPPPRVAAMANVDKSKVLPRPARSASMSQNTSAVPVVPVELVSIGLSDDQRRLSAVTDIISSYIDDGDYQRRHSSHFVTEGKPSAAPISTGLPPGSRPRRSPVSPPPRAHSPSAIQQHS